jgi:cell division protein FtsI/penicillin-binding protein 2
MLVSVVKNGYGRKGGVSGYLVAGKTGTAQIPEAGGYSEETIHSFGGFFPAYDARFALLVKIDKVKGINFAADSVAPIFSQIAEHILNYYEIAPSQ